MILSSPIRPIGGNSDPSAEARSRERHDKPAAAAAIFSVSRDARIG
jgi:hypothetical protein